MSKPLINEEEIIQMTLENVRSFYSRDKDVTTAPMTGNFMWIGSNDFQWCEGLDEFTRVTKMNMKNLLFFFRTRNTTCCSTNGISGWFMAGTRPRRYWKMVPSFTPMYAAPMSGSEWMDK